MCQYNKDMGNSCGKPIQQRPIIPDAFSPWMQYYENDGNTICKIRHDYTSNKSELVKTSGYKMPGDFLDVETYVIENSPKHPRYDVRSRVRGYEQLMSRRQIQKPEQTHNVRIRSNYY